MGQPRRFYHVDLCPGSTTQVLLLEVTKFSACRARLFFHSRPARLPLGGSDLVTISPEDVPSTLRRPAPLSGAIAASLLTWQALAAECVTVKCRDIAWVRISNCGPCCLPRCAPLDGASPSKLRRVFSDRCAEHNQPERKRGAGAESHADILRLDFVVGRQWLLTAHGDKSCSWMSSGNRIEARRSSGTSAVIAGRFPSRLAFTRVAETTNILIRRLTFWSLMLGAIGAAAL